MSFSFRSLFQRDAASDERGGIAAPSFGVAYQGAAGSRPLNSSMHSASTMQSPAGASPFQIGNPLFKTAGNEPITAPPINSNLGMSPFSVAGATPTNAPLTVGDVIAYLPPEVVRGGAVPVEQPLALPPMLLDNALRSGQAALPLFELYRVCPALFQTPISPQDSRMVPLPASKLPGLVARARDEHAMGSEQVPSAHPEAKRHGPASPPPESPFQMARPASGADPIGTAPVFPTSPFAVASPGMQMSPPMEAKADGNSRFAARPPVQASSFEVQAKPEPGRDMRVDAPSGNNGSPFAAFSLPNGRIQGEFPPSESPFAVSANQALVMPSPSGNAAPASSPPQTISQLFSPKPPENLAAIPSSGFAAAQPSPSGAGFSSPTFVNQRVEPTSLEAPQAQAARAGSVPAIMSFTALVKSCSSEELGFNPAAIPAWITTSIPAAALQQPSAEGYVMELGALIDGISDVGFRNTLTAARREVRVRLPQNEVFHALTQPAAQATNGRANGGGGLPPMSPRPSANAFVIQPGASAGQLNHMEAGQSPGPSAGVSAASAAPAPLIQPTLSSAEAHHAHTAPFSPSFGSAVNPFESPTAKPPVAHFQSFSAPQAANVDKGHNGFPLAPLASASQSDGPAPGLAGIFKPFGSPPPDSPFANHGLVPSLTQSPAAAAPSKPFDPFAAGAFASKPSGNAGLSSAQLLGHSVPAQQPSITSAFSPSPEPVRRHPVEQVFQASPAKQPEPEPPRQPTQVRVIESQQEPWPGAASGSLFGSQPVSADFSQRSEHTPLEVPPPAQPKPASSPKLAPASGQHGKMAAVNHSFLGLAPLDTQTDQLLLRALLGTEENLSAPRVVELLASQGGLSACVCLHASHVLSHADVSNTDAVEFQRQAPDIARQLRGLAPLIGIDGAETFTLNAGGRLLTFCFPGDTTVAVLHDDEPSTGLRDKITLIARELARMLG